MPLQFYSPNAKMTGGAMSVSFNSKENSVFLNLIKQTSWDPNTKKGTFKGGKTINFKLTLDEVGSIIHTIRNNGSVKFYHNFGEKSTTGNFSYFSIKSTDPKYPDRTGFGLVLKDGTDEFRTTFTVGSATNLAEYLVFALNHCYSAIYAEDKRSFEERKKQKSSPPPETVVESPTGAGDSVEDF